MAEALLDLGVEDEELEGQEEDEEVEFNEEDFSFLEDYWAANPDADELVQALQERVREYRDSIRQHPFWNRILRSMEYYHGFFYESLGFDDWFNDTALSSYGDQEELIQIDLNHVRSVLSQIVSIVTQNPPAFQARAVNNEQKSQQAALKADHILEYYNREKRVERFLKRAVEDALVLSAGFVKVTWDPNAGEEIDADPQTGEILYEGDLDFSNPKLFDVAWDMRQREWERVQWVCVRTQENKWDLAVEFPEHAEDILAEDESEENWTDNMSDIQDTDQVDVQEFFHKNSPSMPGGRYVLYVGDNALIDGDNPYDGLPLHRIVPAEVTNSTIGYTPGFDLQGPQEALNHEASTICSNHAAFGVQNVFSKTGNNVQVSALAGGLNLVEAEEKPEAMNLTQTPDEVFNFLTFCQGQIEILSGVNSVARGQPEESLKSGAALALVDSKAVQAASGLVGNYRHLIEDVGTAMIRILQSAAKTERMIEVVGKHDRYTQEFFTGEELLLVSRVVVESGNAFTDTVAGKMEIANHLLERGMVRTPQEYLTVVTTGRLDPLTEADQSQLHLVHEENERLQDGDVSVLAVPLDSHILHIKEHQALLNTTEIRQDENMLALVFGHIQQHLAMLANPEVLYWQQLLQFEVPPAPAPMPTDAMNIPPGMGLEGGGLGTEEPPGAPAPGLGEPYEAPGRPDAGVNMPGMPNMPAPAPPLGAELARG